MVIGRVDETVWRRSAAVAALGALLLAGCEIAPTTAPAVEPRVVVHAVLNPSGVLQTIIVERTLGSSGVGGTIEYQPIGNARVVIYGPRGDSSVAAPTGNGDPGRYRVQSITVTDGSTGNAQPNVLRIRPGERYALRVTTSLGVVTGETTVPVAGVVDAARRTFNLDRDTLRLNTSGVRNAAGFLVRHETTNALHEHYTTRLEDALVEPLTGEDPKWAFSFAHESIYPGIAQRFTIVALDSNYFRYYVAGFDPFGDDTRGNTLTGGVGLFGSVATLMLKVLDLTADTDTPIEGVWNAIAVPTTLPLTMTLYSSPYYPGESVTRRISISGTGQIGGNTVEAYGWTEGVGATVQFFGLGQSGQSSTASGSMNGLDLVLTDTRTGERATYKKR